MGSSARQITAMIRQVLEAKPPGIELVTEDGSTIHVQHRPLPGVRIRIIANPHDGTTPITVPEWERLPERSRAFPADLPFLPDTIIFDSAPDLAAAPRTVTYRSAQEPRDIADALIAQSAERGWVLDDPLDLSFANTHIARLHRGARARHVIQVGEAAEGVVLQDMANPNPTA